MPNPNKNLDGVRRVVKPKAVYRPCYIVPPVQRSLPQKQPRLRHIKAGNLYFSLAVVALVAAFTGGMMTALRTPKTEAQAELIQEETAKTGSRIIPLDNVQVVSADASVPNDVLFNTPLQMLKDYLSSQTTPDILGQRTEKLAAYLKARNSPFEAEAETIASQDHWRLILAISFAESTLGKRCYFNNCSGIGGSNIRTYKSLQNWILDFNRLLERRYKNQTLEQMCGVYVQPCNPNWLLATRQILAELDEMGIE